MDAATGLLYVGKGQYYDPATGRFLTRENKPNSPNPYLPFDPTGAMLGPLGVLALVLGSKRKKSKYDVLLFVLVFAVVSGTVLVACGPGEGTPSPAPTDPTQPPADPTGTSTPIPSPSTTPTPAPDYVPEAPSKTPCGCNVWNFENWKLSDESFTSWLDALQTYSQFCNADPGPNVTWFNSNGEILKEELLAILVAKEANVRLIEPLYAKDYYGEAIGRVYWEYCKSTGCEIINNIADSRLISFFAYFSSWRTLKNGIGDIRGDGSIVSRYISEARNVAKDILDGGPGGAWKTGKDDNLPYDIGNIDKINAPIWLVQYANLGPKGFEPEQVVFVGPSKNSIIDLVLTPAQKRNLCWNNSCFNLSKDTVAPQYVKDFLQTLK